MAVAERTTAPKRSRGTKDTFPCPHCHTDITLLGTSEGSRLLGTNESTWASWKVREGFPEPVWNAGQGSLWLKQDLLDWFDWFKGRKTEKAMSEIERALEGLAPEERKATVESLMKALMETEPKKRRGRPKQS